MGKLRMGKKKKETVLNFDFKLPTSKTDVLQVAYAYRC